MKVDRKIDFCIELYDFAEVIVGMKRIFVGTVNAESIHFKNNKTVWSAVSILFFD
jgi:hypothetical protein